MNYSRYDALFEDYLSEIVLTRSQADAIDTKLEETLSLFMREYEGDVEVYSQGSYAMGTTVRPLTARQSPNGEAGDYDVDIVLERTAWGSAVGSLVSVRNVLSDEYSDKLDAKLRDSCERVHHSVNEYTEVAFHIDYVPIKYTYSDREAAHRRDNRWFSSNTKELIDWFGEIADNEIFLRATVLILKRMRDTAGLTDTLSSIAITALVCDLYVNRLSYAGDLINVVEGIIRVFDVPHEKLSITVGPLPDDLAWKINANQQQVILNFFKNAHRDLLDGFESEDLGKLRTVLSSSFPARIESYPEALEPLRNRGWGIETDGSLRKAIISEYEAKGTELSKRWRKFIGVGERLEFRATQYDKQNYGIRWQVLNAADSPQIRGELFEAHAIGGRKNSNEFINFETEQYEGTHWIRYYVYSKATKRVVEIGEKFFVEVEK